MQATAPLKADLRSTDYYRLPWTINDNILGWLEPTKRCNLYCEGCYSRNDKKSDKSLEQVRSDLQVFTRLRNMDGISIAGGDPLVHPQIVDIVRMVTGEFGMKCILNTNGLALTEALARDLAAAGLHGFTFHIDSSQGRPGWKDKNELELCELRLHYAKLCQKLGLSAAFNSTVFPHTVQHVPALMDWARDHIDVVHGMVFILFRTMRTDQYDYFANGARINADELVYYDQDKNPRELEAREIVARIRQSEPCYDPCAYLGGTKDPNTFKWLLAGRLGRPGKTYGYVGRRYMEIVQTASHLLTGKYLAYSSPKLLSLGQLTSLPFLPFDEGTRRAMKEFARDVVRAPWKARRMYFQSVVIIQPIDVMADGEANMCDGCPDMTVHNGELHWSCRLDERLRWGCNIHAVPKCQAAEALVAAPTRRRAKAPHLKPVTEP
ncbi:MAG: radical SAM protein [Deltaproteobacteria bacterium]|nr:radical SAM protein [Deltaproteobacteria bacterium]